MAEHTKGPWGDNKKSVIVRGLTFISHAHYETEEGSANARLIASAPELLEALVLAEADIAAWEDEFSKLSKPSNVLAVVRASIAKATQP